MINSEDELEALVLSNASREKTFEQKSREGMVLEGIEKLRAKERQGTRTDLCDEPSHKSEKEKSEKQRSLDIVANKVGFNSGRQYERTRNVVNKIDELKTNRLI